MDSAEKIRQEIIQLRKQLNALESSRQADGDRTSSQTWEKLVNLSRQLEDAEERAAILARRVALDVNRLRESIIAKTDRYQAWRREMAEMESHFLACVVRPGYQLKIAVQQREYLAQELQRIQKALDMESYPDGDALDDDIRAVLLHNQQAYGSPAPDQEEQQAEQPGPSILGWEVDELVDAFLKENLEREFKRIVLPAVHPDTSDTDLEVFHAVHEVYQNRDYLMMEAYLAQYRGPVQAEGEIPGLESLDEILEVQEAYLELETRLEDRLTRLFRELTPREMENPQQLKRDLEAQREEIIARLQDEAVVIQHLIERIQQLSKNAPGAGGEV